MSIFSSLAESLLAGIGVLLLFGLAVFIHELGHFLAARWLGFTIDTFSIGFGPALWKRRVGDIEYRISAIPFGGYVALPQLDPSGMDKIQGEHGKKASDATDEDQDQKATEEKQPRQLADVAPWRRIIVAIAGPLGNILLAVALAWIIYFAPDAASGGATNVVGNVHTNSAAYASGLRSGDVIKSVGGKRIHNWSEFVVEVHLSGDPDTGVETRLERGGQMVLLTLPVAADKEAGFMRVEGVEPRLACIVGMVTTNSPAEAAGLLPYDIIATIDGDHIAGPSDMVARIHGSGGRPVGVGFERAGKKMETSITPRLDPESDTYRIGIVFHGQPGQMSQWLQYRKPWLQIKNDATGVFRILQALFAPKAKGEAKRAATGLSGPLAIFVLLWYQVKAGLIVSLAFLRFLCINLALLNLLPLPVLDGGHIVFALYEVVSRRKPNAKFIGIVSNVFAIFLIGLMVSLVFRDFFSLRRLFGRKAAPEPAVESVVSETPLAEEQP